MSQLLEESFKLNKAQGAGYFPARPAILLKEGRYRVIRKLGYGSRSSVWLVADLQELEYLYKAVKILTAHATDTSSSELEILQAIQKFGEQKDERELVSHGLPNMQDHFMEKGPHGDHLCLVLNLLGPDVSTFQRSTPNNVLPVYAVKVIMEHIVAGLNNLHKANIIHGAIKTDNFLFWVPTRPEDIDSVLLTSTVQECKIEFDSVVYPIVRSQPVPVSHHYGDTKEIIERGYSTLLNNVGHAKFSKNASDFNIDIQAIGSTTYELLTGKSLPSGGLELSAVELALIDSKALHVDDITPAAAFIHACLQNTSVLDLLLHDWLSYQSRTGVQFE